MKKRFVLYVLLLSITSIVFSYDFRQIVFGNNFQNIKEVTDKYEIEMLNSEFNPLIKNYNDENGYYTKHGGLNPLNLDFYKIYKESYSNGTIYRILRYYYYDSFGEYVETGNTFDYFLDGLYQFVIFKNKTITKCLGVYEVLEDYGDGGMDVNEEYKLFKNFGVISNNSVIKAFLVTSTFNEYTDFFREKRTEITKKSKGYWLEFNDKIISEYPDNMDLERDKITYKIEASYPLVDKDRPFMYTLQNAFDGNEKTSFVEDTTDNLLYIKIIDSDNNLIPCKSLEIINGYASNENLYKTNNRIHKINSGYSVSFECNDNNLNYQITDWDFSQLNVETIYTTDKCNDTCLAEINFLLESEKWLVY